MSDVKKSLLINAKEVAFLCGISRPYIYVLLKSKKFPNPIRLGRKVLWQREKLELWIRLNCPNQKALEISMKRMLRGERGRKVKLLFDSYVKQILCDGTSLKYKDIPDELVGAKREQMKSKCLLKET